LSGSDDLQSDTPDWSDIGRQIRAFAIDAGLVIRLRSLRLAKGGRPAGRELAVMVAEKWYGHSAYAKALATGRLGRSPREIAAGTLSFYGTWVRDNRERLSRGHGAMGS